MVEHPHSTDSYSDFGVFEDRLPPFSFEDAWTVGWRALKRNYWVLVGASVGFFALQAGLNLIAGVLEGVGEGLAEEASPGDGTGAALLVLSQIIQVLNYLFVVPMVSAGFAYIGLLAVRWQASGMGKLFFGFTRYWILLRTALLEWAIWSALLALVGVGLGVGYVLDSGGESVSIFDGGDDFGPGILIGGLASMLMAFAALLWIAPRLWFTHVLIVDPMSEVNTARDALRGSWNMTHEHRWAVLGLVVLTNLVVHFSMLLCCFPVFFIGLPLVTCIQAASYEMLRNSQGPLPGLDERDELPVPEEEGE